MLNLTHQVRLEGLPHTFERGRSDPIRGRFYPVPSQSRKNFCQKYFLTKIQNDVFNVHNILFINAGRTYALWYIRALVSLNF